MNSRKSFEKRNVSVSANRRFDNRNAFMGMPTIRRKESVNNLARLEQSNSTKEARITALIALGQSSEKLEKSWAEADAGERAQALQLAVAQLENKTVNYDFLSPRVRVLIALLLLFITSNMVLSACTSAPETTSPVSTLPAEAPEGQSTEAPPQQPTIPDEIDISEVSGEIKPDPTDAAPTDTPVDLSYPEGTSGWVDDDNSGDREIIEAEDPDGLNKMDMILFDQAGIQTISVEGTEVYVALFGYAVVIRATSGEIVYAVEKINNLPYPHLTPFGTTLGPDGERQWKLVSKPLSHPNNTQRVLESGNGAWFIVGEYDANGNLVEILDQRDGSWKKVENFKLSLERAQQIVKETASINGDYGYNANGGVCAIFDEKIKDWIAIPFTEESISQLSPIQYEQASREYFVKMIIWKVNNYGEPGNGAKEVRDANGNLLFLNALSVDAFSLINGEWQVVEVPIINFRPDLLIFSDGGTGTKNFPENPVTLDQILNNLSRLMYYSAVPTERRSLYDDPATNDYYGPDANTLQMPEFSAGDVIELDFTKEGQIPASAATQRLIDWMGIDPSIANPEGLQAFLQSGDTSNLAKNDRGIPKLFSTGAQTTFDLPKPK